MEPVDVSDADDDFDFDDFDGEDDFEVPWEPLIWAPPKLWVQGWPGLGRLRRGGFSRNWTTKGKNLTDSGGVALANIMKLRLGRFKIIWPYLTQLVALANHTRRTWDPWSRASALGLPAGIRWMLNPAVLNPAEKWQELPSRLAKPGAAQRLRERLMEALQKDLQ